MYPHNLFPTISSYLNIFAKDVSLHEPLITFWYTVLEVEFTGSKVMQIYKGPSYVQLVYLLEGLHCFAFPVVVFPVFTLLLQKERNCQNRQSQCLSPAFYLRLRWGGGQCSLAGRLAQVLLEPTSSHLLRAFIPFLVSLSFEYQSAVSLFSLPCQPLSCYKSNGWLFVFWSLCTFDWFLNCYFFKTKRELQHFKLLLQLYILLSPPLFAYKFSVSFTRFSSNLKFLRTCFWALFISHSLQTYPFIPMALNALCGMTIPKYISPAQS